MPAFIFKSTKANFHITGEKLTIVANKTYLKRHALNEHGEYEVSTTHYSYPEAAIVAGILKKMGYEYCKIEANEKEQYTFNNHSEISLEMFKIFSAICVLQDLISFDNGVNFIEEFAEYKRNSENADHSYSFFSDKTDDDAQSDNSYPVACA